MTNRGRSWLYKKTASGFAQGLNMFTQKEVFIDTSWLEDPKEGEALFTQTLSKIKEQFNKSTIIIIKDLKWKPHVEEIKNILEKLDVRIAEVDIRAVEYFAREMNPEGLIEQIIHQLRQNRE